MSAFHVVVRPRPEHAPSPALAPLYGLFDVVVDGVNITARIGDGLALSFLAELAQAVSALCAKKRDRAVLQLYADEDVWELGLEASGDDVLLSVYRTGPLPEVAVFERPVSMAALREGVLSALAEPPSDGGAARSVTTALRLARRSLGSSWPPQPRRPRVEPLRRHRLHVVSALGVRQPRRRAERGGVQHRLVRRRRKSVRWR